MRKGSIVLIFLFTAIASLAILPNLVSAGPADFWKSCCDSGCDYSPGQSLSFGGTTYYCCGPSALQSCNKAGSTLIRDTMSDSLGWKTSPCVYADDDSICGDPNWPGGGCTGNAACAGKVAGGSDCDLNCQSPVCTGSLSLSKTGTGTCTVTAVVSVANCLSTSAWQVRDDGTVKCSGTGNVNNYNCPSWTVTSGSSGTTYTYNLYIDDVKKDTKQVTCSPTSTTTTTTTSPTTTSTSSTTTTIGPTTTSSTTTTTLPSCGNSICEFLLSENQTGCPQDCKTYLQLFTIDGQQIYSTTFLKPNQKVKAIVTFNDSRYNSTQGFNLKLTVTIDDLIIWDSSNGCNISNKKLSEMGCSNCGMSGYTGGDWHGTNYPINVHMENGYGRIEFDATLPPSLVQGTHTVKVTPILYSFPITLKTAEAQIIVADGLYSLVMIVRDFFEKLTGLFIYPFY